MKRVCVFAGSAPGVRAAYAEVARALAQALVTRGLGLVYGGASVGLMGVLADAMLAAGGAVIGVIPRPLAARELAHQGLTELRVVGSMHERKATMAELSDAFVALPGGLGTLEETFEVLTWIHLGIHQKPIGVLSAVGYWDPLRTLLEHAAREGFVTRDALRLLLFADTPDVLLDGLASWRPSGSARPWLDPSQT